MRTAFTRFGAIALLTFFAQVSKLKAQDTLHLNYHHTQILPHDSTQAKIDKWVKSLNGRHVNIKVVGYYHRAEFKKFAQQRCDELFLVLNRKARALITIDFIGPKKGEDWQRTMVDIVYFGAPSAASAASPPAAKAEPEKPAPATAAKKETPAVKKEEKKEVKSEKAEEKTAKKEEKQEVKEERKVNTDNSGTAKLNISIAGGDADAAGSPELKEYNNGLIVKKEDVQFLRDANIVVARSNNPAANAVLEKAVNAAWTFNSKVEVMDYNAAAEKAKTDKNMVIMSIGEVKCAGKDAGDNKIAFFGKAVVLERAKGKVITMAYIPALGEELTDAGAIAAVSAINSLLRGMIITSLPDNKGISAPYTQWTPQLAGKTLLLAKEFLAPGLKESDITENYKGKYELTDFAGLREAISSKSNKAYVVVTRGVMDGGIYYVHYLMDAHTGLVYSVILARNSEGKTDAGAEAYIGTFVLSKYSNEL